MNFDILSLAENKEEVFKEINHQLQSEKNAFIKESMKEKSLSGIGSYNIEGVKSLVSKANIIFYGWILLAATFAFLNVKMFRMDESIFLYSVVVITVLFLMSLIFVWIPLKKRVITVLFYEQVINKKLMNYIANNINPIVLNYLKIKSPKKEISYALLEDFISGEFDDEIEKEGLYMTQVHLKNALVKEVWKKLDATK